jgi:hypothetical protein
MALGCKGHTVSISEDGPDQNFVIELRTFYD